MFVSCVSGPKHGAQARSLQSGWAVAQRARIATWPAAGIFFKM
jgi:hypothetical protein